MNTLVNGASLHPRAAVAKQKSIKFISLFVIAALVVLGATSVFVFSVQAQSADNTDTFIENDIEDIDSTLLEETPEDVITDSTVTPADLEIDEPAVLPDQPILYGFKNLFRNLGTVLTFDKTKKAERKIQHASERLVEAQTLLAKKEAEGATGAALARTQEKVERLLDDYQNDLDSAISKIEEVKDNISEETDTDKLQKLDRVLDNLTDRVIKHDKLVQKIEEKIEASAATGQEVNEDRVINIIEHKEKALAKLGKVLTKVEADPEKVAERLDRVVENQRGSEFKQLKAMEVLKTVEDKLANETAKEAIKKAREKMIHRLGSKLNEIPEAERFNKFKTYMNHMQGNAIRHHEIVDEIKTKAELPEEFIKQMEQVKQKMARKFERQMNKFKGFAQDKIKEQFLKPLEDGDPLANLRLAQDLKRSIPEEIKQEIAQHEQASVQKFREAFSGDDNAQVLASEAERLMAQMRENPDPNTFRALEELEKQLTPEQQAFVYSLQQEGAKEMSYRMQLEGEKFFNRIATGNPEDFEIFDQMKGFMPPESFGPPPFDGFPPPGFGSSGSASGPDGFQPPPFDPSFDPFAQMKEFQTRFVAEHIQNLDDPAAFARIKEKFEARPDLKREFTKARIEGFDGGFDKLLIEREVKIDEIKGRTEEEFRFRMEDARQRAEEFGAGFKPVDFENELREHKSRIEREMRARFELDEFRPEFTGRPGDDRPAPFERERHHNDDQPHDHDFEQLDDDGIRLESPEHDGPAPFERRDDHDFPAIEGVEEARRRRLEDSKRQREAEQHPLNGARLDRFEPNGFHNPEHDLPPEVRGASIGPQTSLARATAKQQALRTPSSPERKARPRSLRPLVRPHRLAGLPNNVPSFKSSFFLPELFSGFIRLLTFNYGLR